MAYPILYSFRRCPYAMRARLAIFSAELKHEHREILLKEKPKAFLDLSSKGTVPVLLTENNKLIEESLDIMKWALKKNDPEKLLNIESEKHFSVFISKLDNDFKNNLDNYKYLHKEDANKLICRNNACEFLQQLDLQLNNQKWLFGETPKIYDLVSLPFIRQFANVDRSWFDNQSFKNIHRWLSSFLDSDRFFSIMYKYKKWTPTDIPTLNDFEKT